MQGEAGSSCSGAGEVAPLLAPQQLEPRQACHHPQSAGSAEPSPEAPESSRLLLEAMGTEGARPQGRDHYPSAGV